MESEHEAAGELILRLDGFEGPLDLLLNLAKTQKVDLAKISILSLVDQYLAVVHGARGLRLELNADWLVMAAWLTWLKSRLLVPSLPEAIEDAELAAAALTERLQELSLMRTLAHWLGDHPQLGQDVFPRGAPESLEDYDTSSVVLEAGPFLRAYLRAMHRGTKSTTYSPRPVTFWSLQSALRHLSDMLGRQIDWATLESFLPVDDTMTPAQHRAAIASTLLASLELARNGTADVRQEDAFGPILVRPTQTEGQRSA
jgi:segregation and condensation protein A